MSSGPGSGDETEPLLPREPTLLRRAAVLGKAGDLSGAFELTERAAFEGEDGAWTSYGNLFAKGFGCTKSKTDAVQCYRRASRSGDKKGTGLLAMCMITGSGMKPEREEGLRILLDMASHGELTAIRNCAWIFRYGEKFGVARDDAAAKRWMKEEQTMRAERHASLRRAGASLPRLQRATSPTSYIENLQRGPYGAGFHLIDNTSTSSLLAPPDAEVITGMDSRKVSPQQSHPSSSPIEVPAPTQPPLSIERFRPKSVPKTGGAQKPRSFSPRHQSTAGSPFSRQQLSSEATSERRVDFDEERKVGTFREPVPVVPSKSPLPISKSISNSERQKRLSSQRLKTLATNPPPLSRRQSMATLMNPLNSMNQLPKAEKHQEEFTASQVALSVPTSVHLSNAPEQTQPSKQMHDDVRSPATHSLPSRERTSDESHLRHQEPQNTAVYGSATVVVDLGGSSVKQQNNLSYAERFVIQCDVRHVGIPLGCTAVTAMWRATALSFKASAGVDFAEGAVPYFDHFIEYAMQTTWYSLWFFTTFLYSIFLSVYTYRSMRFPMLLLQDFEDPILTNFFAAIAIVAGVLTIAIPPPVANQSAIEAMFFFLLAYKGFLSVGFWYTDWLFSTGHNSLRRTSPIFFMAVINFFILSTIAAILTYVELAVFMFLLGSVMWLIVFTTSFSFIAKTYEHGVDKPSPTLFCFLAPYVPRARTSSLTPFAPFPSALQV